MYADYTRNSPWAIKRWFHRRRFAPVFSLTDFPDNARVLDYGCGDGYLLSLLSGQRVGFEPFLEFRAQAEALLAGCARVTGSPPQGQFDRILCLEVCEHLAPEELEGLFLNIRQLAAPEAEIIFSVPVETGLMGAAKCTFRRLTGAEEVRWLDIVRVALGRPVRTPYREPLHQPDGRYIYSHVGFSAVAFEAELRRHFEVLDIRRDPAPWLPSWLSNGIYFRCR